MSGYDYTDERASYMNQTPTCFVIMPFGKYDSPEYQRNLKIYQQMIKPVVEECDYKCIRGDELEHLGYITRDIIELLFQAELVVADLSGRNANVFYELGVRHVLFRCGTIPVIREGENLPFDIANYRAVFYSTELDGPAQFREDLRKQICKVTTKKEKYSDNPVHDILGEKLKQLGLDKSELKDELRLKEKQIYALEEDIQQLNYFRQKENKERDELLRQIKHLSQQKLLVEKKMSQLNNQIQNLNWGNYASSSSKRDFFSFQNWYRIVAVLALMIISYIGVFWSTRYFTKSDVPKIIVPKELRAHSDTLSNEDVTNMLQSNGFFSTSKNTIGKGWSNYFEQQKVNGEKIVFDYSTGLIWQQGGSPSYITYEKANTYIIELNQKKFAGFKDWHMPTLEEAMSLMESKKSGRLYIDSIFERTQYWIWTADPVKGQLQKVWVVNFYYGGCLHGGLNGNYYYVRAVRSVHSSEK